MKKTVLIIACSLFLLSVSLCAQEDLAKAREKADHASPSDCAKSCFEAARQLVDASNKEYGDGNVEQGLKLMNDALVYARRGTEASIKTHKNQKNAEIALRKMAKRVHDVSDSLALDDRPPVMEDQKLLERLRDDMLAAMFGSPKKSLGEAK